MHYLLPISQFFFSITSSSSFSSDDPLRSVVQPAVFKGGDTLVINQREISAIQILSFFVSSALLSLFDAVSRGSQNIFLLFTFVFKYSLRKALVKAHAFCGHVSLEMLV